MPYAFMKLFMINGVFIKAFSKLKMAENTFFVKHWLNSVYKAGFMDTSIHLRTFSLTTFLGC